MSSSAAWNGPAARASGSSTALCTLTMLAPRAVSAVSRADPPPRRRPRPPGSRRHRGSSRAAAATSCSAAQAAFSSAPASPGGASAGGVSSTGQRSSKRAPSSEGTSASAPPAALASAASGGDRCPLPPGRVETPELSSVARRDGGTPGPWSATPMTTAAPSSLASASTPDGRAAGRQRHGVEQEVALSRSARPQRRVRFTRRCASATAGSITARSAIDERRASGSSPTHGVVDDVGDQRAAGSPAASTRPRRRRPGRPSAPMACRIRRRASRARGSAATPSARPQLGALLALRALDAPHDDRRAALADLVQRAIAKPSCADGSEYLGRAVLAVGALAQVAAQRRREGQAILG